MTPKIESFQGEYRWLSNFWPCNILYEEFIYPSVENAYQAAKTLSFSKEPYLFGHVETNLRKPFTLCSAAEAKKLGRQVAIRSDWEEIKLSVMKSLSREKYKHVTLRQHLIDTGDAELIEGNTWGDTYWGVCKGVGENHLGRILMKIRAELQV